MVGSLSALSSPLLPQTIKKTRFPHWDEVLELREMPGAPSPLRVELWDWDMVGKNDFLGMVSTAPPLSTAPHCPQEGKGGGLGMRGFRRIDVKAASPGPGGWSPIAPLYSWGDRGSQRWWGRAWGLLGCL